MDALFYIVGGFLALLIVFVGGYLAAVRECSKEVRFYKNLVAVQRVRLHDAEQELRSWKEFGK